MFLVPTYRCSTCACIYTCLSTNTPWNLILHQAFCAWQASQIVFHVEGAGINLILDCIGGPYWEKNVNCLAVDGCWVLYGLMGGKEVNGPLLSNLLFKWGSLISNLGRSRDKKVSDEWKENYSPEKCDSFHDPKEQKICHILLGSLSRNLPLCGWTVNPISQN